LKRERHTFGDNMKKIQHVLIAAVLLAGVVSLGQEIELKARGGAYGVSPDMRWKARITGGIGKSTGRRYARVELWDLKKYPELSLGIYVLKGKTPEFQLVYPEDFHARDSHCKVSWATNSMAFTIDYAATVTTSSTATRVLRQFTYSIGTGAFELRTMKKENTEPEN